MSNLEVEDSKLGIGVVLETLIPFGLWFKATRWGTVCVAVLFHLSLDYSMNLFLFQWFMIVGLLSFMSFDTIPLKFMSRWLNPVQKNPYV